MNWLVHIRYFCTILSVGDMSLSLSLVISFDSFDFLKRRAKCKFFLLLWRPGRLLVSRNVQNKTKQKNAHKLYHLLPRLWFYGAALFHPSFLTVAINDGCSYEGP